jgi:hypothetical protein
MLSLVQTSFDRGHVTVACHNQEKLLRGHLRVDQTEYMNPGAARGNIFETALDRPRSIAGHNQGVERSIETDPRLGSLISGQLGLRSLRRFAARYFV